jgi:adenylosuccinate synthase
MMKSDDMLTTLEAALSPLQTLVVVGGSWGDEGKGKVIDLIARYYDIVVRFSGGCNAGHTVFTDDGRKVVSHLIPCGQAQGKTCVMARGEFFDAQRFLDEYEEVSRVLGGQTAPILIDQMCPLWTPWHSLLESWIETSRGGGGLNTTRKAIGPLAGLNTLRLGPVVGDLLRPKQELVAVLKTLHDAFLPCFREMGEPVPSPETVADHLLRYLPDISDKITDTSFMLHESLKRGQRLLFEGAQALGLDRMWGTYPFVSSGFSSATGASMGTGLPMNVFPSTLMVTKVLPTRVGAGPFPSEIGDREQAEQLPKLRPELFQPGPEREQFLSRLFKQINAKSASNEQISQYFEVLGDERGATTGRGRSVGYLDIPWLQYAQRINGANWLALTRLDMLTGLESLPVVVAYELDGQILPPGQIPPPYRLGQVRAITEEWPCWSADISGCTDIDSLPSQAAKFILRLECALNLTVLMIGTGPERNAMVVRRLPRK